MTPTNEVLQNMSFVSIISTIFLLRFFPKDTVLIFIFIYMDERNEIASNVSVIIGLNMSVLLKHSSI